MQNYIDKKQIAFILFGIIVGYGNMTLPRKVASIAGTGSWLTLILATLIVMIFTYIIVSLNYSFPNKSINNYCAELIGNKLSKIVYIIYAFYFFILFIFTIKISCELINLSLLNRTPVSILVLIFLILIFYTMTKNIYTIANICQIYGIIIMLIYGIIQVLMLTQGEYINIRPLFVKEQIPNYLQALPTTIFSFIGIEILFVVPFHKSIKKRKLILASFIMVIIISILYILQVESCIGILNLDGLLSYQYSLYSTILRTNIESLQIFQRIDGIFLIAWLMSVFCTLILESYATIYFTNSLFNKNHKTIISILVMIIAFIISLFPITFEIQETLSTYIEYLGYITLFIIPSILFITLKVKIK